MEGPVSDPIELPVDSQLMTDMMESARFMVNLKEAKLGSITNEEIMTAMQKMIDNNTIDCMFATVSFAMTLIEKEVIKRPVVNFAARFMSDPKKH